MKMVLLPILFVLLVGCASVKKPSDAISMISSAAPPELFPIAIVVGAIAGVAADKASE
jgi:hypothetical protein